jgi:hypothetical protein
MDALEQALLITRQCRSKHFSFLARRNRIICFGTNQKFKSHPDARRNGYRFDAIHSELACMLKARQYDLNWKKVFMINTRIDAHGTIKIAKPCPLCEGWLSLSTELKHVCYTNRNGEFSWMRV